jgi:hypothetical protein
MTEIPRTPDAARRGEAWRLQTKPKPKNAHVSCLGPLRRVEPWEFATRDFLNGRRHPDAETNLTRNIILKMETTLSRADSPMRVAIDVDRHGDGEIEACVVFDGRATHTTTLTCGNGIVRLGGVAIFVDSPAGVMLLVHALLDKIEGAALHAYHN